MTLDDLPENALLLMDTSPIIYVLEDHPIHKVRFQPLFEAQAQGRMRFATTTIALAEVMAGPLKRADEAGARRCRAIIETWRMTLKILVTLKNTGLIPAMIAHTAMNTRIIPYSRNARDPYRFARSQACLQKESFAGAMPSSCPFIC